MAGFFEGLEPELLPVTPVGDYFVDAIAWGGVMIALIVLPMVLRLWRLFIASLTQRSSSKLPAAERTFGERLSLVAALILCFLMWGILLYCAAFRMRGGDMVLTPGSGVAVTAAAAFAGFVVQLAGYYTVGYAFANGTDTRSWVRALCATQAMLGYWIMIPAMGALLFPSAAMWLLWVGIGLFMLFRMLLWVKCFKIFYTDPFSILYFFLYLCTLETVPLLLPVGMALLIC